MVKEYSTLELFLLNPKDYLAAYAKKDDIPQNVKDLAREMQEARLLKNYSIADEKRAEIASLGYRVMISKDGVTLEKV